MFYYNYHDTKKHAQSLLLIMYFSLKKVKTIWLKLSSQYQTVLRRQKIQPSFVSLPIVSMSNKVSNIEEG